MNVVHLPGLARKPEGDLILCDVARPDASIIVEELRQLGIAHDGSISIEPVKTQLSDAADAAAPALGSSGVRIAVFAPRSERFAG